MSEDGSSIVCRRCGETIPLDAGNCPHCGQSIRGNAGPLAGLGLGLVLIVAAALSPGQLLAFGVLGLLLAAAGGYLLYDKRQRMQAAVGRDVDAGESDEEGESIF